MPSKDDNPSADEQRAFSETYDLSKLLLSQGCNAVDVGKGVLISAITVLQKELSNQQIAEIFYEVADDYAVRDPIPR